MDSAVVSLAVATNLVGGLGMLAVAGAAYRRRSEPGMHAFACVAGLFGAVGLGVGALFAGSGRTVDAWHLDVALPTLTALALFASVPWVVFVLQYTGRSALLTRRRVAALGAPAVVYVLATLLMALLTPVGVENWGAGQLTGTALLLINATFVTMLYLFGAFVLGALVLVRDTTAYSHVSARMGVLLAAPSVAIALLVAVRWAITMAVGRAASGAAFGATLVAGAACYALVLRSGDAFGSTWAAAASTGRQATLQALAPCVLTLDDEHRVVDVNEAARETFGLDDTAPLGEPVEGVLGTDVADLGSDAPVDGSEVQTGSSVFLETVHGRRRFHVETVDLVDEEGRDLGVAVSLEDVTDRALREQRISILNRVLRHNLRNKLSIVRGHAEMLPAADDDAGEYADAIEAAASDLLALGERARDVERLLAVDAETVAAVGEVAEDVVERRSAAAEDVAFKLDVDEPVAVRAPREALSFVLDELCENAAKHNDAKDPRVTVRCDRDGDWGRVRVIDNGPTLDEQELVAVDAQGESPLEHGSGLGLWSVRWIVTAFGGHLGIEENEPRGSVVQVLLPVADDEVAGAPADGALAAEADAATAEQVRADE